MFYFGIRNSYLNDDNGDNTLITLPLIYIIGEKKNQIGYKKYSNIENGIIFINVTKYLLSVVHVDRIAFQ